MMKLKEPALPTRSAVPAIPVEIAQHYIGEMLAELHGIARYASLDEIALMLKSVLTVIEANALAASQHE